MATLTLGGKTVLTQTGSDEPILGSNLTGSPGFDLSSSTFPAGHVLQINHTITQASVMRSGNKNSWAYTNYNGSLPNNLKSNSKLFCIFSCLYGEQEGGHWSVPTSFTFYQNSMNIVGNQLTFTDYVGGNANAGGGNTQEADRGLASANLEGNSQYMRSQVFMQALFTPTGTDAAKKEVQVWWWCSSTSSFNSVIGQGTNATGGDWQRYGATVVTMMEIAG
tara:strand:+ start:456 stop:1118 length:663 start_codon:yes stop_codon:yes gene_type:complete